MKNINILGLFTTDYDIFMQHNLRSVQENCAEEVFYLKNPIIKHNYKQKTPTIITVLKP